MRITYVCSRAPWPADHGANVRTARLIEGLAAIDEVTVLAGGESDASAPGIVRDMQFFQSLRPSVSRRLSLRPAEGIGSRGLEHRLAEEVARARPEVVIWENSLLAEGARRRWRRGDGSPIHVVEFANIEQKRYAAMARSSGPRGRIESTLEGVKARRWEPLVARWADGCIALSAEEQAHLSILNPNALLVRNAMSPERFSLSKETSRIVLAVGSWWYEPNRHGLDAFIREDWERILRDIPDAQLRIVGKGEPGVSGRNITRVGFVDDLSAEYAASAVVLAPALSGAGSQLKIAGAHEHGRIVVGPPFMAREAHEGLPSAALIASESMAASIVRLIKSPGLRNNVERELDQYIRTNSWASRARSLHSWLEDLVTKTEAPR